MNLSGLYVHVPFCKTKCHYCDFFSVTDDSLREKWLDAVCLELEQERRFLGPEKPALRTVYFGGGTPSQLTAKHWERIFQVLECNYDLSSCVEITLEANPDDLTSVYLKQLRMFPFNRISLGVQSFVDEELQAINRRHSAQEAADAIARCREAGFENISGDLMYGLPGQTPESFAYSLQRMLSLPVSHISSYALSWEEGSVLYAKLQDGTLRQSSDETLEQMFFQLKDSLENAGFEHYELSNFAKAGCKAMHNSSYWNGTFYLGVGPAAHSFNGAFRRFNPSSLDRYCRGVQSGVEFRDVEMLDPNTAYNDFIITRLRCMKGLSVQEMLELFGPEKTNYCLQNAVSSLRAGSLEQVGDRLRLTRKGLFISDAVMADLLLV